MVSILEKIGIRQIKLGIIFIFMILIFVLLNNIFGFQENFVLEFDTNDYVLEYDGNVKGKQFNFKELETDKVIKTKELCIGETCVTPNDLMFLDKIPIVNDKEICLGDDCIEAIDLKRLNDFAKPGLIVAYNGNPTDLPANWAICDGTNGTPDLSEKFVMGKNKNNPNQTNGGSNTITLEKRHLPEPPPTEPPQPPLPTGTVPSNGFEPRYMGCYRNEGGRRKGINGKEPTHEIDKTWEECKQLAKERQYSYFGMEYPQCCRSGKAQCLLTNKLSDMTKGTDAECRAGIDGDSHLLGSSNRVAMYGIIPDMDEQIDCANHYKHYTPMDQSSNGDHPNKCPSHLPYCVGYISGSTWGKCRTNPFMRQKIGCYYDWEDGLEWEDAWDKGGIPNFPPDYHRFKDHRNKKVRDMKNTCLNPIPPDNDDGLHYAKKKYSSNCQKWRCPKHLPKCVGPPPPWDGNAPGQCYSETNAEIQEKKLETTQSPTPGGPPPRRKWLKNDTNNVDPINVTPEFYTLYYIMMIKGIE